MLYVAKRLPGGLSARWVVCDTNTGRERAYKADELISIARGTFVYGVYLTDYGCHIQTEKLDGMYVIDRWNYTRLVMAGKVKMEIQDGVLKSLERGGLDVGLLIVAGDFGISEVSPGMLDTGGLTFLTSEDVGLWPDRGVVIHTAVPPVNDWYDGHAKDYVYGWSGLKDALVKKACAEIYSVVGRCGCSVPRFDEGSILTVLRELGPAWDGEEFLKDWHVGEWCGEGLYLHHFKWMYRMAEVRYDAWVWSDYREWWGVAVRDALLFIGGERFVNTVKLILAVVRLKDKAVGEACVVTEKFTDAVREYLRGLGYDIEVDLEAMNRKECFNRFLSTGCPGGAPCIG